MIQKWEYKIIKIVIKGKVQIVNFQHLLEELGKDGWELTTIFDDHAYFKRTYFENPSSGRIGGYFDVVKGE